MQAPIASAIPCASATNGPAGRARRSSAIRAMSPAHPQASGAAIRLVPSINCTIRNAAYASRDSRTAISQCSQDRWGVDGNRGWRTLRAGSWEKGNGNGATPTTGMGTANGKRCAGNPRPRHPPPSRRRRCPIPPSRFPVPRISGAHQLLVRDPVRLIRVDSLPPLQVLVVRLVVPLVPHHLAVPLEREDVRRDAVEEPAIVRDDDRAPGEVDAAPPRARAACRRRDRSSARRAAAGCRPPSASSRGAAGCARRPRGRRPSSADRRRGS